MPGCAQGCIQGLSQLTRGRKPSFRERGSIQSARDRGRHRLRKNVKSPHMEARGTRETELVRRNLVFHHRAPPFQVFPAEFMQRLLQQRFSSRRIGTVGNYEQFDRHVSNVPARWPVQLRAGR